MNFDDLKRLALWILANYETAWSENAALRVILDTYPMPDGSKGIPRWQEFRDEWLAQGQSQVSSRFEQLRREIASAQDDSELVALLRKIPATGKPN
jgi:hypothetical protein